MGQEQCLIDTEHGKESFASPSKNTIVKEKKEEKINGDRKALCVKMQTQKPTTWPVENVLNNSSSAFNFY